MCLGAAPSPAPGDFRNEFDRLMMIMIQDNIAKTEHFLHSLDEKMAELEKTKTKTLQAEILREINIAVNLIEGAKAHLERELKRTDLDLLEKFNFDSGVASITVLVKDLNAFAAKVKAVATH